MDQEFHHPEAFCLMMYQCEECRHSEVLWNARDGVTPMFLDCPKCTNGRMAHINWHKDKRSINYIPLPGQRIFINMPMELRIPVARQIVASNDGTPQELRGQE